jgi:hypothetical protein
MGTLKIILEYDPFDGTVSAKYLPLMCILSCGIPLFHLMHSWPLFKKNEFALGRCT